MNDQELNAIRSMWDALSAILEEPENEIEPMQRTNALAAIDEMQRAFPHEA